ncbi:hypothetical protein [Treponema sp. C6A8]|uniref:hypothetical protein n=1 Tax=Treponema sp. C6A8 TaxID=1410609 RepID=UPI00048418F9|nr:hypothetical protein [Treponema sp. C6A8]
MKKRLLTLFSIILFSSLAFSAPGGPGGPGGPGPGGGAPGRSAPPPSAPPPAPGSNPPGQRNAPPPPPAPSAPSGGSSSSSVIINYRGQRKLCSNEPLEVVNTSLTRKANNYQLAVHFNQAVDTAKISSKSLYLNGKKVDSGVIIKFNRKSDAVTITFVSDFYTEEEIKKSKLVLKNVQTFDGKVIEEIIVK